MFAVDSLDCLSVTIAVALCVCTTTCIITYALFNKKTKKVNAALLSTSMKLEDAMSAIRRQQAAHQGEVDALRRDKHMYKQDAIAAVEEMRYLREKLRSVEREKRAATSAMYEYLQDTKRENEGMILQLLSDNEALLSEIQMLWDELEAATDETDHVKSVVQKLIQIQKEKEMDDAADHHYYHHANGVIAELKEKYSAPPSDEDNDNDDDEHELPAGENHESGNDDDKENVKTPASMNKFAAILKEHRFHHKSALGNSSNQNGASIRNAN
eukprot:PhM_4_TR13632/c0_g1_i2/m.13217